MHGVPENLDLSPLQGTTLTEIGIGQYQITFNFDSTSSVAVEGGWELVDSDGRVIDCSQEHESRSAYKVHVCIGREVSNVVVNHPESVEFTFDNGYTLRVFDDSTQYECFHIEPGDIHI